VPCLALPCCLAPVSGAHHQPGTTGGLEGGPTGGWKGPNHNFSKSDSGYRTIPFETILRLMNMWVEAVRKSPPAALLFLDRTSPNGALCARAQPSQTALFRQHRPETGTSFPGILNTPNWPYALGSLRESPLRIFI
jgi:hypothetical protein